MSLHTPEPWKANGPSISGEHGFAVAMADDYAKTREAQIANAARIVACVNYCAGMTNEQLTEDSAEIVREELTRVQAELDDMRTEWAKAADQRDQLLEALSRLAFTSDAREFERSTGRPTVEGLRQHKEATVQAYDALARAALAQVKA